MYDYDYRAAASDDEGDIVLEVGDAVFLALGEHWGQGFGGGPKAPSYRGDDVVIIDFRHPDADVGLLRRQVGEALRPYRSLVKRVGVEPSSGGGFRIEIRVR